MNVTFLLRYYSVSNTPALFIFPLAHYQCSLVFLHSKVNILGACPNSLFNHSFTSSISLSRPKINSCQCLPHITHDMTRPKEHQQPINSPIEHTLWKSTALRYAASYRALTYSATSILHYSTSIYI